MGVLRLAWHVTVKLWEKFLSEFDKEALRSGGRLVRVKNCAKANYSSIAAIEADCVFHKVDLRPILARDRSIVRQVPIQHQLAVLASSHQVTVCLKRIVAMHIHNDPA